MSFGTASPNYAASITIPVTTHPAPVTVVAGTNANFGVTVSGVSLSYAWFKSVDNEEFHIITAWNPKRILSEQENRQADVRLRTQLEQEQLEHFRVTGCSADLTHQEAGWGIVGISLDRANEIGLQYGQNAIVAIIAGEAFIVNCETPERQSIGRLLERLKA